MSQYQLEKFSWDDPNLKFQDAIPNPSGDSLVGLSPILTEMKINEDGTGTIKIRTPQSVQANPTDLV